MDAYRASIVKQNLLSRNYYNAPTTPKEYYRYYISLLKNKEIPARTFTTRTHQRGIISQANPIFPRTIIGLVQARKGELCLFDIGVTVSYNLVVVPATIDSDWQVEFYTCFNGNKFYQKCTVRKIFTNYLIGFSVLTLEEQVSHIVGAA